MATELLERTVIRMFDDDDVVYERIDDDCVEMIMPTRDSLVRLQVLDREIEPPMLTIRVVDFVRFTDDKRDFAISMCNELNLKGIGKFVMDKYGDVSFRMDYPAMDTSGPDEFRHTMILAVSWFSQIYPVVMKMRWADMSFEEALKTVDGKADDEDEDGDSIMSDEDIRNLLMGGVADNDDEDDE